ncbi:hypothetical protein F5Y17DRAFT_421773 [Xylariaceae sp. FL0594]|nr:hypothetical protein F5Y17DRAFT_421773 [Xylariaceae sp. FL0594]
MSFGGFVFIIYLFLSSVSTFAYIRISHLSPSRTTKISATVLRCLALLLHSETAAVVVVSNVIPFISVLLCILTLFSLFGS